MRPLEPLFLTVKEVIAFHQDQIRLFGGTDGIRDRRSLESAVAMPQSGFDGTYLHQDLFEMAAAYAFHLAENQPFLDGNKRTALNAAIAFLGLNGYVVVDPEEALYDAMIGMSRREVDKAAMAQLLRGLSAPDEEEKDP